MSPDTATTGPGWLRAERARLVASTQLGGRAFAVALAGVLDDVFAGLLAASDLRRRTAVVAMGSYGRRELSPGSDVDVMLLVEGRRFGGGDVDEGARALWYPLWDAGFTLGHAVRTTKDALTLAGDDLEALTSLLDGRFVAGDRALAEELGVKVRSLAAKRQDRVVGDLAGSAALRRMRPGPIAEMLDPDLKDGSGGLRDVQALSWAGLTIAGNESPAGAETGEHPDGLDALMRHRLLGEADRERLLAAREHLLDVRLALHRVTGGRTDLLTLQEQDAVADALGRTNGARLHERFDADDMIRSLAAKARDVAWISRDVWDRLLAAGKGPSRAVSSRRVSERELSERELADGVVVRDGRVAITVGDDPMPAATVLEAACVAAEHGVPFERISLGRCASMGSVSWGARERDLFVRLLGAGRDAIPVFEALDHVGVLAKLLPEWDHVRSRPQRNAYHRFTVDRHLLEAVAECAALLPGGRDLSGDDAGAMGRAGVSDEQAAFDENIAQHCRPDLLLLGALLHDIAKGRPEDHSVAGAEVARTVGARMGLDPAGIATLAWLVEHHLLMADTATRRDLADETTILRFGRAVGTAARLDLLYVLTIGDSKATGPAAWNPVRASLVRELHVRTDALLETGIVDSEVARRRRAEVADKLVGDAADSGDTAVLDAFPASYAAAFDVERIVGHLELIADGLPGVGWREVPGAHGRFEVTVVARDRPGLLAGVAGALGVLGLDIHDANVFSTVDRNGVDSERGSSGGIALEVFVCEDGFGRLGDADARAAASEMIAAVAAGERDVTDELRERRTRYRKAPGVVRTRVDLDASTHATVVEVEAPDEVGLLATIASVFADLEIDVTFAKVQTLADRVIDVFYVQDATGAKLTDRLTLDRLRATIVARLTSEYLPGK